MDTNEIGGTALVVGFLVVLLTLYRNPASGIDAAAGGVATLVYFVVLPVAGLFAGVYAYKDGPYSGISLFLLGSYLGMFGLGMVLGSVLGPTPIGLPLGLGIILSLLSLVALVASVLRSVAAVRLGGSRGSSR